MERIPQVLNNKHILVAHFDALGKTPSEISELTGYNANYVLRIKKMPEYIFKVEEIKKDLSGRILDDTVDLVHRFKETAPKAVDTMESIMLHSEKDSDRFKAAQDWLDRSPNVPQKARQTGIVDTGIHIIFSETNMSNMKRALEDIQEGEIVELLEDNSVGENPKQPEIKVTSVEDLDE